MRAYRPPSRAPVSAAWTKITARLRVSRLTALRRMAPNGPRLRASVVRALELGRGDRVGPDHDPVTVLDLLDALGGRPEVVLRRVEGQVAVEVVSAPFACRESQIAFWSRLPAALTPAARISHAFQDAAAWVSNTVYGRLRRGRRGT